MKEKRNTECKELARRYTAGEMTASEIKSFELHLAGCQACKMLVSEWNGLFSALSVSSVSAMKDPGPDFDRPVMAFVRNMLAGRAGVARAAVAPVAAPADTSAYAPQARSLWAAALRSKIAWACAGGVLVALTFLGVLIHGLTIVLPSGERQYVNAITWLVNVVGRSFDWLVFQFMRGIKVGEVLVVASRALDPLWHSFRVAARNIDPEFILIQLLLFTLSLVLLRAVVAGRAAVGAARKGRGTHVEIMF